MWAVFKKELKSYFLSPIGYVVVGILLLSFTIFFYSTTIAYGSSVDLGALYAYGVIYGLLIVVPILTMRTFAEERKSGTEQLILTSPVSVIGVVLGKFFAALGVIAVALIISLMYFAIMCYFGSPSLTVTLVYMLGFLFVSGAGIAIGMFASSITENQVIAGVLTMGFLILSLFLPAVGDEFPDVAIINFYDKFSLGLISIQEVVGALTFTAMFIAFTIIVMQRRKLVK